MSILDSFSCCQTDEIGTDVKQPYSLEAADANAIEEVNLAYENVKEVECLDITKEGCDAWDAAVKRYEERIGKFAGEKKGRGRVHAFGHVILSAIMLSITDACF